MRFSTIFTVLAAGVMAFAGAVPEIVEKRSNTDITTAFNTLSSACDTILPKFNGCNDISCTTEVVAELKVAIGTCTSTLGGVSGGLGSLSLANTIVAVVTKIINALEAHKSQCGSGCPGLIDVYADIDLSLSVCLQKVFGLCLGLLAFVTVLLLGLVATLQDLGCTLILTVCSLL